MASPRFTGIIPPLITPLHHRDQLDEAGLEKLVNHLIQGGVHGLFLLGTTGEAPGLSYRLRREIIERVCRQVNGKIPVLVGITDTAFVESVSLADFAARSGADAVVLTTPYYFPAGQTELMGYLTNLVEEVSLPVMLYNMPELTKVWFEIPTLEKLTEFENIVGLKDSSGDLDYYFRAAQLKRLREDWSILIGPERYLSQSLEVGGDGGVHGGANLYPRLFVELYEACREGNATRIGQLEELVDQLGKIYEIGKYPSRFIKGTKCAASILGICDDFMAEPFNHFYPPERSRVETIIGDLNEQIALLNPAI